MYKVEFIYRKGTKYDVGRKTIDPFFPLNTMHYVKKAEEHIKKLMGYDYVGISWAVEVE